MYFPSEVLTDGSELTICNLSSGIVGQFLEVY